jgi:hypothetical protein
MSGANDSAAHILGRVILDPVGWMVDTLEASVPGAMDMRECIQVPMPGGFVLVDEYLNDEDETVWRVGIYEPDSDPFEIFDTPHVVAAVALIRRLLSPPEGVSWADWAVAFCTDIWPDDPASVDPLAGARSLVECPDHFVGAESLRCESCGWDAALRTHTATS